MTVHSRMIAAIAISLVVAGSAHAAKPGFYIGAGLGQAEHDVQSSGSPAFVPTGQLVARVFPYSSSTDAKDTGWNALVGYRINDYLSAELTYLDFGKAQLVDRYRFFVGLPNQINFTRDFSVGVSGPSASVIGFVPLAAGFGIFARAGYLFAAQSNDRADAYLAPVPDKDDKVPILGAGLTWSFAQRWMLRGEYQRTGEIEASTATTGNRLKQISLSGLFTF